MSNWKLWKAHCNSMIPSTYNILQVQQAFRKVSRSPITIFSTMVVSRANGYTTRKKIKFASPFHCITVLVWSLATCAVHPLVRVWSYHQKLFPFPHKHLQVFLLKNR